VISSDISLGNHQSEPSVPLLSRRRCSTDVLQCEEHLPVSQRLSAAAAGTAHVVMVTEQIIMNRRMFYHVI